MSYSDKQLQILETAERLFATKGFNGTSVRDIARDADVNVAMISYYFGSKEKLLQAIFEQRTEAIKLQIESMLEDNSLSSFEKVNRLIDAYIDKIFQQQDFHKIMVGMQVTEKDEFITCVINDAKKRNHQLIGKLISEGQKNGEFKKHIDVPLMMVTLIGTANQLVTTQKFYRQLNNMEAMPEEEFQKYLKKKLSLHLKGLFKAILTYDKN